MASTKFREVQSKNEVAILEESIILNQEMKLSNFSPERGSKNYSHFIPYRSRLVCCSCFGKGVFPALAALVKGYFLLLLLCKGYFCSCCFVMLSTFFATFFSQF